MDESQVNLNNARPGVYTEVIDKIAKDRICPFCIEHLTSIHPNPLDIRKYWIVTDNAYPYKPKKEHILLIYKTHIDNIDKMDKDGWVEIKDIIEELKKDRGITGGTFIIRFGDTKFTGATVTHLHAHLFQSDPDDQLYDHKNGVLVRIG